MQKLNLEDLQIYNTSIAATFAQSLSENEHFCSRLEELEFRNIEFNCTSADNPTNIIIISDDLIKLNVTSFVE